MILLFKRDAERLQITSAPDWRRYKSSSECRRVARRDRSDREGDTLNCRAVVGLVCPGRFSRLAYFSLPARTPRIHSRSALASPWFVFVANHRKGLRHRSRQQAPCHYRRRLWSRKTVARYWEDFFYEYRSHCQRSLFASQSVPLTITRGLSYPHFNRPPRRYGVQALSEIFENAPCKCSENAEILSPSR